MMSHEPLMCAVIAPDLGFVFTPSKTMRSWRVSSSCTVLARTRDFDSE